MRNFVIGVIVSFVLGACQQEVKKFAEIKNYPRKDTLQKIILEHFSLDNIPSSYVGELAIANGNILFVDSRFCWVFEFTPEGKLKKRHLGQGNGPSELPAGMIDGYACLQDGSHFFMGPSNDCYVFDKNFQSKSKFMLKHKERTINPESPDAYTLYYFNMGLKNYGNRLYSTVIIDDPVYNFIVSPEECFRDVHVLMEINLQTGELESVKGYYPDIYRKDPSLRHLHFAYYDVDKSGNFYLAFEGDSTIYTFDSEFRPLTAFGYAGKEMSKKEAVFHSLKEFQKGYAQNRRERGIYTGLKYIEDTGFLFRTYQRGEEHDTDGLQIYKNQVLIGDVEVPKHFKVLGYIPPYYYGSEGIDEENESISLHRFQL